MLFNFFLKTIKNFEVLQVQNSEARPSPHLSLTFSTNSTHRTLIFDRFLLRPFFSHFETFAIVFDSGAKFLF